MLDYVLTVTGKAKLFYVGHSQGTIMAFAGFTFNQSLAQHIQAFFALAPVTTVEYIQGAFRILADYSTVIYVSFCMLLVQSNYCSPSIVGYCSTETCGTDLSVTT